MAERDSNMPSVPTYAGTVAPYALSKDPSSDGATVLSVTPDSPAYDIGLEPGMRVLTVNGKPLTDMIVWLWETRTSRPRSRYSIRVTTRSHLL